NQQGIVLVENDDGKTISVNINGKEGRAIKRVPGFGSYIYFIVDDSFKFADEMDLSVEVEYYDDAPGVLGLEYDGSDPNAPFNGAYTRSPETIKLTGDKTIKKATFTLPQAKLVNGQNRSADFRLVVNAPSFTVIQVIIKRK
ncbi:MAG TPA: hypothetical protein PLW02_04670, partial [Verrucomicrobiota bacterium]|nr:hypothetical protein [Verrucomicrobiota bacterium]